MPNLRIFGSQIHDTAAVVIVTSTISSIILSFFGELGRTEANICLLSGFSVGFLYWYTQYKVKK